MWWMNQANSAKEAKAATTATVRERSGTAAPPLLPPRRRSTTMQKMKVPSRDARRVWLRRSVWKVRRTRGLSCAEARVSATSVTEKASPATDTVTVPMVPSRLRAASVEANSMTGSSRSSAWSM